MVCMMLHLIHIKNGIILQKCTEYKQVFHFQDFVTNPCSSLG